MIRKDWTERPAVAVWRDLVKGVWWTTADTRSSAAGTATVDAAFYGPYTVTVSHDGQTVSHYTSSTGRAQSRTTWLWAERKTFQ